MPPLSTETKVSLTFNQIASIVSGLALGAGALLTGVVNNARLHDQVETLSTQVHQQAAVIDQLQDSSREATRHFDKIDGALQDLAAMRAQVNNIDQKVTILAYKNKLGSFASGGDK